MQALKIDRTKCYTPQNYAKKFGVPQSTVYHQISKKLIETVEIDGVVFVYKD